MPMTFDNTRDVQTILAAAIARAKAQVLSDLLEGRFAKLGDAVDITSFSQLHDCVDANYYGDAFNEAFTDMLEGLLCDGTNVPEDERFSHMADEFFTPVQTAVHTWLEAGGLTKAAERVEQGEISAYLVSAAAQGCPVQLDL